MITPSMEQCTIKLNGPPTSTEVQITERCNKISILISDLQQRWDEVPEFCPHINVVYSVDGNQKSGVRSYKEKCFSDYRLKTPSGNYNQAQFTLKSSVSNTKFSADIQVELL